MQRSTLAAAAMSGALALGTLAAIGGTAAGARPPVRADRAAIETGHATAPSQQPRPTDGASPEPTREPDPAPTAEPTQGVTGGPAYTFVAAPDFLNQDVGDLRTLPTWRAGDPNSWTPQLESSIDVFLDEVADQDPQAVLVPGDLVEGHWTKDTGGTGIFGPSSTTRDKVAMVRRAGNFYHSLYRQRFEERGLDLYPAVGDHDIGDNPWSGPRQAFKREHVGVFKDLFATWYLQERDGSPRFPDRPRHSPWEDTAYATSLSPDVLLVSVDVFHRTRNDVRTEVVGKQLAWLRQVLHRAQERGTRWVIVQGHTPVLGPVRYRSSSDLGLRGGAHSPFWRVLERYGVDMYLAGEVHDTSVRRAGGVTQVATGGLLYKAEATYLLGQAYDDRLELEVRELDGQLTGAGGKLWQLGAYRTNGSRELTPGSSHTVGTLTLRRNGDQEDGTGKMVPLGR